MFFYHLCNVAQQPSLTIFFFLILYLFIHFTWFRILFLFLLGECLDPTYFCVCVLHHVWFFFLFSFKPKLLTWVLQTSLFSHFFIKNGFHSTIHTFKNYFTTMFLIFSKINCIQTDLRLVELIS